MLTNEILKPVKVDLSGIAFNNNTSISNINTTTITAPASSSSITNKNILDMHSNNHNEYNQNLLDLLDVQIQPVISQQNEVIKFQQPLQPQQLAPIDIDLSYFEKKLEPNSSNSSFSSSSSSTSSKNESSINHKTTYLNHSSKDQTNSVSSISNTNNKITKKEPNAKLYLDKLLQDIFLNKNQNNSNNTNSNDVSLVKSNSATNFNPNLTKSDVFSDKKCNFK
jgi:hypothetical protein